MKGKTKAIVAVVLVLVVVGAATVLCTNSTKEEPEPEQMEVKQPVPLVITNTQKNEIGTLTIYDEHGDVLYQYKGEIDVKNSGWNSEEVEVVVTLPSARCSCFDEEADNEFEAPPDNTE